MAIAADDPPESTQRVWPHSTLLSAAALGLIAFCTIRTVARGYVPLDDNGIIEARALDVLGGPLPLLGSVSSASIGGGTVHHPGPLLLDILSIPVRVLPAGTGVAVGAAVINAAAVAAVAWVARRLLGAEGAVVIVVATCALMWSLGSEALTEAWQPIVVLLPFLLGLVAAWGWGSGHDVHALVMVLAISLAMQTHGSYLIIGPALVATAAACRFRARARAPLRVRPLAIAAGAGLLVWLQPLADQVGGTHNMGDIVARASGSESGSQSGLGIGDAIRAAGMVLVKPPFWTRPGVDSSLPAAGGFVRTEQGRVFDPDWMTLPIAIVALLALLGGLATVVVAGWRRADHELVTGGVIALVVIVAGIVTLAGLPTDSFGFSAHKARWLWPTGAYLTAYLLVAVLRLGVVPNLRQAAASVTILGAVALMATVPTSYQLLSPQHFLVGWQDAAGELRDAAGELEDRGVVFLDTSGRRFPDPYNDTLAAELVRRGIDFRVAGDYVVGQYGGERRLDDEGADVTARVFVGDHALLPPPGFEIVVFIEDAPEPVALAISPYAESSG